MPVESLQAQMARRGSSESLLQDLFTSGSVNVITLIRKIITLLQHFTPISKPWSLLRARFLLNPKNNLRLQRSLCQIAGPESAPRLPLRPEIISPRLIYRERFHLGINYKHLRSCSCSALNSESDGHWSEMFRAASIRVGVASTAAFVLTTGWNEHRGRAWTLNAAEPLKFRI